MELETFIKKNFCNLKMQQPRLWTSGDLESVSYSDKYFGKHAEVEQNSFWFSHRNKVFLSAFFRHSMLVPFVDVGGGTGVVSGFFHSNGADSIVVEPLPTGAQIAHQRGLVTIQSTLEQSGVQSGTLPTIGMFDVLEHIEDDIVTLENISQALAPGGHFMIAVPAYQWLWSDDDIHAGHFRRYTKSTLVKRLRSVGLEIVEVCYLFSFLILPILLLRSVPSFWGRRGSAVSTESSKSKETHSPGGFIGRFFRYVSDKELNRLENGRSIPFGTSVFVVARKPKQ